MRIERPQVLPSVDPHSLPKDSQEWQVAEFFEAHFLKEMVKNMRKTVQESPETKNNRGLQIFREMLDGHYAETAAKSQGIGLAEMIVKQILEAQQLQDARQGPVPVRELNKSDTIKK